MLRGAYAQCVLTHWRDGSVTLPTLGDATYSRSSCTCARQGMCCRGQSEHRARHTLSTQAGLIRPSLGWWPTVPAALLHSPSAGPPCRPTPAVQQARGDGAGWWVGGHVSTCTPVVAMLLQHPAAPFQHAPSPAQPPSLTGPAMSRCAHSTPSLMNSLRKRAAVMLPPARPPEVCVCVWAVVGWRWGE